MNTKIKYGIFAFFAIIVALIIFLTYASFSAKTLYIQGEAEANRVDVSARVQGRAAQIFYDVGDNLKQGDILLILSSPALEAQKALVESQLAIAKANRDVTYSTRPENIDAQKAALEKSEADLILAQTTYNRLAALSKQQSVSRQQLDEAKNKLDSAIKAKDAAHANYELAINGSSPEAKNLADAQVKQAEAALAQVNVDLAELVVKAPIDGQITAKIAELGQLYNPGTPLFSLVNLDDIWLVFNIREDMLHNAKVGDIYKVSVPALNEKIEVKVTAINALGQYANWKATKATGDFDLKTFEVRAKPTKSIDGLRPGMSATATWSIQ